MENVQVLVGQIPRFLLWRTYKVLNISSGSSCQDKVLKDMDEQEEMKTCSSSEEESDETDDEVENERRLQRALLEKDKVSFCFLQSRVKTCAHKFA